MTYRALLSFIENFLGINKIVPIKSLASFENFAKKNNFFFVSKEL